jgi:hypothetical protein
MIEYVAKNKAINLGFYFGVTANLVNFAIDVEKSKKKGQGLPQDNFHILTEQSDFITFTSVRFHQKGIVEIEHIFVSGMLCFFKHRK